MVMIYEFFASELKLHGLINKYELQRLRIFDFDDTLVKQTHMFMLLMVIHNLS